MNIIQGATNDKRKGSDDHKRNNLPTTKETSPLLLNHQRLAILTTCPLHTNQNQVNTHIKIHPSSIQLSTPSSPIPTTHNLKPYLPNPTITYPQHLQQTPRSVPTPPSLTCLAHAPLSQAAPHLQHQLHCPTHRSHLNSA